MVTYNLCPLATLSRIILKHSTIQLILISHINSNIKKAYQSLLHYSSSMALSPISGPWPPRLLGFQENKSFSMVRMSASQTPEG